MTPENLSSRLEVELWGKAPEEQWGILVDVRSYLLGRGEEGEEEEGSMLSHEDQAQYDAWTPSERQLEREWAQLMSKVPPEEADEVNPDFDRAPYEDRKHMVWDVRTYLATHDAQLRTASLIFSAAASLTLSAALPSTTSRSTSRSSSISRLRSGRCTLSLRGRGGGGGGSGRGVGRGRGRGGGGGGGRVGNCFKCGQPGHYTNACPRAL
jgi:hypothetical protein